jgi:hypothetical protein
MTKRKKKKKKSTKKKKKRSSSPLRSNLRGSGLFGGTFFFHEVRARRRIKFVEWECGKTCRILLSCQPSEDPESLSLIISAASHVSLFFS